MQAKLLPQIQKVFKQLRPEYIYKNQIQAQGHCLKIKDQDFVIDPKSNVYLLAMGKAAAFEAKAVHEILQESEIQLKDALVITKYNHAIKDLPFKTIESSHPVIDENSLLAGAQALSFVEKIASDDFLIFCLSGGASALVEAFSRDVDFKKIQKINQKFLNSGMGIEEFNLIRKSISKIKNGGLFKNLKSPSVSLITCDIPSGNLASVSSAPSIYTPIDTNKLYSIINKNLDDKDKEFIKGIISQEVNNYSKGKVIKMADAQFLGALAKKVIDEVKPLTEVLLPPFDTCIESGKEKIIKNLKHGKCHVSLGELNIKVKGSGLGGRNTHFVLNMAYDLFYLNTLHLERKQLKDLFILSVGTDGSDGPTDAAGAYFSFNEFEKCSEKLIIDELFKFDSYHFFEKLGTLIKTGPTGTNLMDLRIICI